MKKYLVIILLCIVYSCNQTSKNSLYIQNSVEITPQNATLKLSDLFHNYKIIPLQGPYLASVLDVLIKDSLLIIKGDSENSHIHLYTDNGIYKKSIIPKGRGPQEAFNIQTVKCYNSDTVEILCNFSQKLFQYSLKNDKIINQINLPKSLMGTDDFIKCDSNRYIFYQPFKRQKNTEYKINTLNLENNTIEQQHLPLNSNDEYIAFSQLRNFYSINERILFHDVFSPGIYQIHEDSISLYIAFCKKQYEFPEPLLTQKKYRNFDQFMNTCETSPYIWGHRDISESNRHILSTYTYKNMLYLNVIDKTTMTSNSYNQIYDDLITDETFGIEEILCNITATNNAQIFTLEPFQLKEIVKKKQLNGTLKTYRQKYPIPYHFSQKTSEEDNSLIILLYEIL